MPGAVPKGFVRIDENDKGGRYGSIYYNRELALKDVMDYELEIGEVIKIMNVVIPAKIDKLNLVIK